MIKQTRLNDNAEIYQPRIDQSEREKLRDMPFRKKIAYLWEYYKVYAFILIVVIALISYIVSSILTPKEEIRFNAAFLNNTIDTTVLEDYKHEFAKHLDLDLEKETIEINTSYYFKNSMDYNMRQVLSVRIASKEIDIIIAPESEFKSYAYSGFFDRLSEQLPTDLYSSMTNRFYFSSLQDDPESKAFGIYLTDCELFQKNADNSDPYLLGIVANAKHKENAVEFIRFLFQLFP
jgi:hypothetical protein